MAGPQRNGVVNGDKNSPGWQDADLAQAFKDLASGERQASQMEGQLDALEKKIDELLAQAEQSQQKNGDSEPSSKPDATANGETKQA